MDKDAQYELNQLINNSVHNVEKLQSVFKLALKDGFLINLKEQLKATVNKIILAINRAKQIKELQIEPLQNVVDRFIEYLGQLVTMINKLTDGGF